jgi:class 3 adenylate cyclase
MPGSRSRAWCSREAHDVCAEIIRRFEGPVGQHAGAVMVYFGYPVAHEDDAHRAVRAGLSIMEEMRRRRGALDRPAGCRSPRASGFTPGGC